MVKKKLFRNKSSFIKFLIIDFIRRHRKQFYAREIYKELNLSAESNTYDILKELVKDKILIKEKIGRNTYYKMRKGE